MAQEKLQVVLELISGQYKREAKQAASATGEMTGEMAKSDTAVGKIGERFNALAATAKVAVAGAATAAVVGFAKDSIRAASDLDESINAVEKTFGSAADRILEFSKVSSFAAGLSSSEFNGLATVTGALLKNVGFSLDDASEQAIKLTVRAADMASVFNTDVSTALEAINSAIKGEMNPIEQFGVKLNDATVRAKAVEMGLADTTAAVDDHGKALAILNLIYEQTSDIQGDFIQTSDSLANRQRILAAEYENMKAAFGEAFTPLAAGFLEGPVDLIQEIQAAFGNEEPLRLRESMNKLFDTIKQGGKPSEALAVAFGHMAEKSDLTAEHVASMGLALGLTTEDVAALSDEILQAATDAGVSADALQELEEALGVVADEASTAEPEMAAADQAMLNMSKRGDAADVLMRIAAGAESATPSLRDMAQAVADVNNRLRETADPAFAAVAAQQRYRDALAEREELQKTGEATAEELAEADLNVAEAALEANAAIAEFGAGNKEGAIQAIADALGVAYSNAEDLLETVGILNNQEIDLPVSISMNPADRALLEGVSSGRLTGPAPPRRPNPGRGSASGEKFRQHGGDGRKGELYRVGEGNKPELYMIPGDNGRFLSFAESQKLMRAMSGPSGGETHLHIHGTDSPTADMGTLITMAGVLRRVETTRRI